MPVNRYSHLLEYRDVERWNQNLDRGSLNTANVFLRSLGSFCNDNKLTPVQLAGKSTKQLENLLLDFVSKGEQKGYAGSYIHSAVKAVKSWLSYNDLEIKKGKIKVKNMSDTPSLKNERTPELEVLGRIFRAANLKQRVACVLMAHSGLRPEALSFVRGTDGLVLGDFSELEIRNGKVSFEKVPTLVSVRKEISKSHKPYLTFLSGEGIAYLTD